MGQRDRTVAQYTSSESIYSTAGQLCLIPRLHCTGAVGARHGTARHGTARHGTARHGTARHGTARHGSARPGTVLARVYTAQYFTGPSRL